MLYFSSFSTGGGHTTLPTLTVLDRPDLSLMVNVPLSLSISIGGGGGGGGAGGTAGWVWSDGGSA